MFVLPLAAQLGRRGKRGGGESFRSFSLRAMNNQSVNRSSFAPPKVEAGYYYYFVQP